MARGAALNIQEREGLTPIHLACDKENFAIAEMLSESGADVNIKDNVCILLFIMI